MHVGEVGTLKITIERLNPPSGASDYVYLKSNKYPYNLKEKFFVFVGIEDKNVIIMADIV